MPDQAHATRTDAARSAEPVARPTVSTLADRLNAGPSVVALAATAAHLNAPVQRKPNRTGLPDALKAGVENLSGLSLDDVRVHRNSPKPAQLQAHAFAQGTDIHLAPGQERHLPHEAWHVVQQKQGRVKATTTVGGLGINDSSSLEREADAMGARALAQPDDKGTNASGTAVQAVAGSGTAQLFFNAALLRYQSAIGKWQTALGQVQRFDHEVEGMLHGQPRTARTSDVANDLLANVNAKSVTADTRSAGEAAEPSYWWAKSPPPVASGPGGGAGIDIIGYQFGSGSSGGERGRVEIKTTNSTASLLTGVASSIAGGNRFGEVNVLFTGGIAQVDALRGTTFKRGGVTYRVGPVGNINAAKVHVESPDGSLSIGIWAE